MSNILKGSSVANYIKDNIRKDVDYLKSRGTEPTLGIIRVGQRKDDISYEKSIVKFCDSVGIKSQIFILEESISTQEIIDLLNKLNIDNNIHGILIFRPLPKHIDEERIKNIISPLKDIDCMNPLNLEKVFEGNLDGFAPCTPKAVVKILEYYGIPTEGAKVAIINRSMVVGRPLSMMMLGKNSTVTICHSKTKNLSDITRNSDIVITALGKAKYFGSEYFDSNSTVIDVGINIDKNGSLCGDVDYDGVCEKVKDITPVPGGVGSVTTSILLSHVILACKNMNSEK